MSDGATSSSSSSSSNPFAKADRWRKHPLLTQTYKHMFPGFFLGAAMFGIYYASEKVKGRKRTLVKQEEMQEEGADKEDDEDYAQSKTD